MSKGFIGLTTLAMIMLIVSLLAIFSFRITMSQELSGWRLTRIAMTHAHLMASEMQQDRIGMVNTSKLEALNSLGYYTSAYLYDPESGNIVWAHLGDPAAITPETLTTIMFEGKHLPRFLIGYKNYSGGEWRQTLKSGHGFLDTLGGWTVNVIDYFGLPSVIPELADVQFEAATYALPVVYGDERKYGVLVVFISSRDDSVWQPVYQKIYADALSFAAGGGT